LPSYVSTSEGGITAYIFTIKELEAFRKRIEDEMKERCAVVCDEQYAPESFTDKAGSIYEVATIDCGDAIRSMK